MEKKVLQQEQPDTSVQPLTVCMQEGTVDSDNTANEKALMEIWNQPPDDLPMLQVGPFSVTRRSFHYIKTTLSDDVIDASLAIILKHRNILHIDCITATAIFHGQQDIHHNLCQVNMNMYEACIGAVNESGGHWVLVIIEPAKKTVTYLNPLGELHGTCAKFLHHWYDFLTSRYMYGYEQDQPEGWSLKTMPHARQVDGTSCGVYVIKFVEYYIEKKSLLFQWSLMDVEKARREIAYRLISAGFVQPESSEHEAKTDDIMQEDVITDETLSKDSKVKSAEVRSDEVRTESEVRTEETVIIDEDIVPYEGDKIQLEDKDKTLSPVFRRSVRNPKMKRKSSFIYPSMKKMKRKTYCMCNKPEDGNLYWQCEACENWLHPECIGLTVDDEPEHFICDACKFQMEEKSDDMLEVQVLSKKVHIQDFIDSWQSITKFLEGVARCTAEKCLEPDHSRHHSFIDETQSYVNVEKYLVGFGNGVFDEEVLDWLQDSFMELMQYDLHPIKPATSARIPTLLNVQKNSKLYRLFSTNLTANYIQFVLIKEALLYYLTVTEMMPYELADELCKKTEFDWKKMFKHRNH